MIVFDLDGTLIDSSRDLAEAVSELVQSYGAGSLSEAEVVPMVGEGAGALVARALARAALDPATPGAVGRFLDIYHRRMLNHTVAYDGVAEVLALLVRAGPLAVLTNKPLAASNSILRHLGLRGFFSIVVGGDGPHGRKPDPAGLRALLASAPGPAAMIGDSPADADTAAAAACPFVLAAYGFGAARFDGRLPEAALTAHHPRELVSLADTLTFDAARVPIVMR
jgi:phosphoglycolate phosphatase